MEWPSTIAEATIIQEQLRSRVITHDDFGEVRTVAGVDAGFEAEGTVARAAVVVLRLPDLKPVDYALVRAPAQFPYVPGFLSFREAPAIIAALGQLRSQPDLVICDGQGLAHPRRFGIACHLGVLTGLPSIGCAKSWLIGDHAEVPPEAGAAVPLVDRDETIGVVYRSRTSVRPIYISIGHRISLATAQSVVRQCITRYRLPETTRAAHNLASHGVLPQM